MVGDIYYLEIDICLFKYLDLKQVKRKIINIEYTIPM